MISNESTWPPWHWRVIDTGRVFVMNTDMMNDWEMNQWEESGVGLRLGARFIIGAAHGWALTAEATGPRPPATGHRPPAPGHRPPATGHRQSATGNLIAFHFIQNWLIYNWFTHKLFIHYRNGCVLNELEMDRELMEDSLRQNWVASDGFILKLLIPNWSPIDLARIDLSRICWSRIDLGLVRNWSRIDSELTWAELIYLELINLWFIRP